VEGGLSTLRRHRYVLAPVLVLLVGAVVAGLLTGVIADAGRHTLRSTGLLTTGGASTLPPGTFSRPPVPPRTRAPEPRPDAPRAVLSPATPGTAPVAKRLTAKVEAIDRKAVTGTFGGAVLDVGTGKLVYGHNAAKAFLPASTLKLLTSAGALSVLGPEHRFSTRVVSAGTGRVVLVGGGDPYLLKSPSATDPDRASLSQLADLAAKQLRSSKRTTVELGYDVSLFSGPAWHPDWPGKYRDQVTPVSALWVNEGRVGGAVGARVPDPAKAAADTFARALTDRGVAVSKVSRVKAPAKAAPLAAVQSLPLERIVEHLLMASDNDAAEVVARQAAIGAGKPGSFAGAQQVLRARLTQLGIWDADARIRDGSGLSRSNRAPADLMVKVMRLALGPAHPELRGVVTGLPVAGVEGSLRRRYAEKGTSAARGLVRGKTGTLTEVAGLVGFVRSDDGSLLAYAFLVNEATDFLATRIWLDQVTGALTTCGCR
jgi:D-alanyl-D-alanine carboxypeptidase/D-alanyl-D-alanine-endopeptidase (penicillin-binding protein 4)